MSGIHDLVMVEIQSQLTAAMITAISISDPVRVGAIKIGPLQGDPDPDQARISLEIYCNDPDQTVGSGTGNSPEAWDDTIYMTEIGGSITWERKFTIKGRCLLESTGESLSTAHTIASTIRSKVEHTLLGMNLSGVYTANEVVSRGVYSDSLRGQIVQSGGPPNAYDFHLKVRFTILTTERIGS